LLPEPYQRGFREETESLLWGLLLGSRSVSAAKESLRKMGLPVSERELETVASDLVEELELKNTAPIEADLLALFVDGKYVEIKENERIRPYTVYVVIGLGRDGKKRPLACLPRPGRESLEEWKSVLKSLLERGLRRVMMVVQDDFSGLLPVSQSLFPQADVQLCIVHMQRNAKRHLTKDHAAEFVKRIRALKASWDYDTALTQFEELCQRFADASPVFIAELRRKRDHYLAFLKYPDSVRRSLSTTNTVEVINKEIEKARINSGGYFQSDATMKLKLGALTLGLERGRWSSPAAAIAEALHQFNLLFETRFEQ
jgi:transposase-like protein